MNTKPTKPQKKRVSSTDTKRAHAQRLKLWNTEQLDNRCYCHFHVLDRKISESKIKLQVSNISDIIWYAYNDVKFAWTFQKLHFDIFCHLWKNVKESEGKVSMLPWNFQHRRKYTFACSGMFEIQREFASTFNKFLPANVRKRLY